MFSDTHFHLQYLSERGVDTGAELEALSDRDAFFALDIGTEPGDIRPRLETAGRSIASIRDPASREKVRDLLHFSLGIWPSKEAICSRVEAVKELRENLIWAMGSIGPKISAIGECGLDHHWNPAGPDGRSEDDFDDAVIAGEAELFGALLSLGRECGLPVICHSREAFDGTIACIAASGLDRGVMHCFSYGIREAEAVLDLGWFISFSGSITYTKKSHLQELRELLRFVPRDRLLIETDAPYLAPGPHRGQANSPRWVDEVYRYAAELLEMPPSALSAIVDQNIRALFKVAET
jgi:TatD DNase family protein